MRCVFSSQHAQLNTRTECRGPTYTVHYYIRYFCVSNCSLADIRARFPAGWMPVLKLPVEALHGVCQSTWRGLLVEQTPYLIEPCDAWFHLIISNKLWESAPHYCHYIANMQIDSCTTTQRQEEFLLKTALTCLLGLFANLMFDS